MEILSTRTQHDPYGTSRRSTEGKTLARRQNWVEGYWENLDEAPIFIRDKYHLKKVCLDIQRRTGKVLIPKAFMKSKSQGKGVEWSF